ncbi:ribonuclease D [Nereida sp. MMG025]|uniref:ribonuclease D n=1 Tax=Nereida sp. MMG025 TaxID=2909981 RepID=UPI001F031267|nr:ribonuclease D [Nereida sp. MMG025]MCF6443166.1 ribonuclease D [Nereida sp. MMG025]
MKILTTTQDLAEFCDRAKSHDYVTIDTEFLRERTYYSKLCLIQMAFPGGGDDDAVLVDPLVGEMSLAPLYDLFRDTSVVKVFHAARQDLEIFFVDAQVFPNPLFDTQVAAMVCGFGEQVGYETLVRKIAKQPLDKSSRFTDWSRRPLSDAQKNYALADVTHLRQIYEFLSAELKKSNRYKWVEEELQVLTSPETYQMIPSEAWRRVKTRTNSGRFMALVQALAEFRETYAQTKNVPRNRVLKDDALLEMASMKPGSLKDLGGARLLMREARKGDIAQGILDAVQKGLACPPEAYPKVANTKANQQVNPALADLLRVLLKAKCDTTGVAQKLVATASELDAIASGDRSTGSLRGWRAEVFGDDALRLCEGKIGLAADGEKVVTVELK